MGKSRHLISLLFFIAMISFQVSLMAQTTIQSKSAIWLRADKMDVNQYNWPDVSGNSMGAYSTNPLVLRNDMNFNAAVCFAAFTDSLVVKYTCANSDYLRIYTVFKNKQDSNNEQFIWSFGNQNKQSLRLSNKKLYDAPKVYQYLGGNISQPVISVVDKYNSSGSKLPGHLYLGSTIQDARPSSFFKGEIAEMLIFNQEMSLEYNNCIASYLSIKYGVSIYGYNYYNSNGNLVWNIEENEEYAERVFAIGRDNGFDLNQKQSKSASSDFIAVSAGIFNIDNIGNPFELEDNSFMFFADNGNDSGTGISVPNPKGGSYYISHKRWKISSVGANIYRIPLSFKVKVNQLFKGQADGFCLIADKNNNGRFTDISAIMPNNITSDSCACFSELNFCSSTQKNDYFTFAITSPLELHAKYTPPACAGALGKLGLVVSGGTAPYTYTISNIKNRTTLILESSSTSQTIDSLPEGIYNVDIVDVSGHKYALETGRQLFVQTPDLQLNSIYSYNGTPVELNVCSGVDTEFKSFEWIKDSIVISRNCNIQLSQEGVYSLLVKTAQGCQIAHQFFINDNTGITDSNGSTTSATTTIEDGRSIKLAPNPTKGEYKLIFSLEQPRNISLYVNNIQGKIIEKRELKNIEDYVFESGINSPGIYIITVIAENKTLFSQKLIVE